MHFEIRNPKCLGDVTFLASVADAMAKSAATAYGATNFHEPAYKGRLNDICLSLLREAKNGRLQVCDQSGFVKSVNEAVAQAKRNGVFITISRYLVEPDWDALRLKYPETEIRPGVWRLPPIDLGASEIDLEASELNCLHTKMHFLNEWGASRGDTFSIAPDAPPWIDERGWMGLASTLTAKDEPSAPVATPANPVKDIPGKLPNVSVGKLAIKAAWEIELESKRAATVDSVMARLQKWAAGGSEPAVLMKSEVAKRGVEWRTKGGKSKLYDVDACEKTLVTWTKSRACQEPKQNLAPVGGDEPR